MNIRVNNLPLDTTDEDLKELFEKHAPVDNARIAIDGFTGSSRGFGFVEIKDSEAAQSALEKLDNTEYRDHKISLEESKPEFESKGSYPARKRY